MIFRRNNEPARLEMSFDIRRRVNRQRTLRDELAEKFSFDDGITDDGFRVEDVTFGFQDELTFGFEIFGNRVGDVVIAQVDVAAAAFAHR